MLLVQETDLVEIEHLILWRMHRRVYKKVKTGFEIGIKMVLSTIPHGEEYSLKGVYPVGRGFRGRQADRQTGRQASCSSHPAPVFSIRRSLLPLLNFYTRNWVKCSFVYLRGYRLHFLTSSQILSS
jgi:hypothetical protein